MKYHRFHHEIEKYEGKKGTKTRLKAMSVPVKMPKTRGYYAQIEIKGMRQSAENHSPESQSSADCLILLLSGEKSVLTDSPCLLLCVLFLIVLSF